MIYKHRYIFSIVLAILLGLLIVNITYAGCIEISQRTYDRAIRWGYQARIAEGYTEEGKLHQWVEWFNPKRNLWCVWDNSFPNIKRSWHTAEELGYERVSYGN